MPAKLRLGVVAVITTSWRTEGACTPAKLRVKGLALTTTSLGHGGVFSLGFSPTLMPERGSLIEPVGSLSRPALCLYSCPSPILCNLWIALTCGSCGLGEKPYFLPSKI